MKRIPEMPPSARPFHKRRRRPKYMISPLLGFTAVDRDHCGHKRMPSETTNNKQHRPKVNKLVHSLSLSCPAPELSPRAGWRHLQRQPGRRRMLRGRLRRLGCLGTVVTHSSDPSAWNSSRCDVVTPRFSTCTNDCHSHIDKDMFADTMFHALWLKFIVTPYNALWIM